MNFSDNSTPGGVALNAKSRKLETYMGLLMAFPVAVFLAWSQEGVIIVKDSRDGSQLGETVDHLSPLVAPFSTIKDKLMIYLSGYAYCAQRRKVYKSDQPLFYLD